MIGGFTHQKYEWGQLVSKPGGPSSEIEIISSNPSCQVGMNPVNPGISKFCDAACQLKSPNDTSVIPFSFTDSDVHSHTAQFTNEAPIQCGGTGYGTTNERQKKDCYEYDYKSNDTK